MKRFGIGVFVLALMAMLMLGCMAVAEEQENWEVVLYLRDDTMRRPIVNAEYNARQMDENVITKVEVGKAIVLSAAPITEVEKIFYVWDDEETMMETEQYVAKMLVPSFEVGSTHHLYVRARFHNGEYTERKEYKVEIVENTENESVDIETEEQGALVYLDYLYAVSNVPREGSISYTIVGKEKVAFSYYQWDDGEICTEEEELSGKVVIPQEFTVGSYHILRVGAQLENGEAKERLYQIHFVSSFEEFITVGFVTHQNPYGYGDSLDIAYGEELQIELYSYGTKEKIEYQWGDTTPGEFPEKVAVFEITEQYLSPGKHQLRARAITEQGETAWTQIELNVTES